MRTYNTQHLHYCGVDLHARSLFVNVLDDKGVTRLEQEIPASPTAFLDAVNRADPVELFGTASAVTVRCHCREKARCWRTNHPGAAR